MTVAAKNMWVVVALLISVSFILGYMLATGKG